MAACTHLDSIRDVTPSTPQGCTEYLQTGSSENWRWCYVGAAIV